MTSSEREAIKALINARIRATVGEPSGPSKPSPSWLLVGNVKLGTRSHGTLKRANRLPLEGE